MIDANEIRLGNRLNMDWLGTQKEIEVKGIFPDKIYFEDYWKDGETFCKPESLSGIPLTEEWFVRLGFESFPFVIGDGWKYETKDETLYFTTAGEFYTEGESITFMSKPCKYIHQLQNLFFALTGEELTLKELV